MWKHGLLIISDKENTGTDLRPAALMSDFGRGEFLSVIRESDFNASDITGEKIDVLLVSPRVVDCSDALIFAIQGKIPYLILGCPRLDARQSDLLNRFRLQGGYALGPGSQGLFDLEETLGLTWSSAARVPADFDAKRHVVLLAQGGTVPFSLYSMAVEAGVRFRRVVSLGNCGDSDRELLAGMERAIDDDEVNLLIISLESLSRGRDFLTLASRAAERKLPIILLRSGGVADQFKDRVLARHFSAGWTDNMMWEAVAAQFGVILLSDVQQIVDLGKLLGVGMKASGRRVGILSVSEGIAMMQADQCVAAGLEVAEFSPLLQKRICRRLPDWSSGRNPAELTEHALNEEGVLVEILREVAASGECDMILVATGALSASQGERLARALITCRRECDIPITCSCLSRMKPLDETVLRLNSAGVPIFGSPCRIAGALAGLWRLGRRITPINELCRPALHPFTENCPDEMSERDAMNMLDMYGLSTVEHRFCHTMDDLLEATAEIGYPACLKVVSSAFSSKQSLRAVALNLRTEEEVRNAFGRILERVSRKHAESELQGVALQKMITDGVECMIGIKRDPVFGPVVAVALGGVLYGLMKDISLRVAPVSYESAMEMVKSLKCYPLLSGEVNGKTMDVKALAYQISLLSRLGCAEPDIELLDIDPVFVRPEGQGAVIVDAFAVRKTDRRKHPGI